MLSTPRASHANDWNRETATTFNEPVRIPSQVLPAGTYIFRLLDDDWNHHIVQVWNAGKTQVVATALAFAEYRDHASPENFIAYYPTESSAPKAIKLWFAPNSLIGEQFIYTR